MGYKMINKKCPDRAAEGNVINRLPDPGKEISSFQIFLTHVQKYRVCFSYYFLIISTTSPMNIS